MPQQQKVSSSENVKTNIKTPNTTTPNKRKSASRYCRRVVLASLLAMVLLILHWEGNGIDTMFDNNNNDDGDSSTTNNNLTWLKREGKSWEVWDKKTVLYKEKEGYQCEWRKYRSGTKAATMCVHGATTVREEYASRKNKRVNTDSADFISKVVSHGKPLESCQARTRQWNNDENDDGGIYLEIGSHIGVCAMEMLLNTNANLLLVEPSPRNLFALTSTLLHEDNAARFLNRIVAVLPIALGKETTSNASMRNAVKEDLGTAAMAPSALGSIGMERLDDLLASQSSSSIRLASLVVNGYECQVLDGGIQVLKRIPTIVFSNAPDQAKQLFCSQDLLLSKFQSLLRMDTYWYRATGKLRPIPAKTIGFIGVAISKKKKKKKKK